MTRNRIGRRLPRPGTLIACAALLAALAGTAYAGNKIGTKQLKNNAVSSAKLQNEAVTSAKLKGGLLPKQGGNLRVNSEAAVSTITASTQLGGLSLPAGSYLVLAKLNAAHTGAAASTRLECSLNSGGSQLDFIKIRLQANAGVEPVIFAAPSLQGFVTLAAPGSVTLDCISTNGSGIEISNRILSALPVAGIN